jgi:hypothetical protein
MGITPELPLSTRLDPLRLHPMVGYSHLNFRLVCRGQENSKIIHAIKIVEPLNPDFSHDRI